MKKRHHHQISVPPAMLDRNATIGSSSTNKRHGRAPGMNHGESGDIISISSPPFNIEAPPPLATLESLGTPNG
jgi:hypothetical protein